MTELLSHRFLGCLADCPGSSFNLDLRNHATLYLLHVLETAGRVDPIAGWVRPSDVELAEDAMDRLASLIPQTLTREVRIERHIVVGSPVREIARFAREKEADMIVVGTHGRSGIARVRMGSTAEGLLREAPCQVLVVKPHGTADKPGKDPGSAHQALER